MSDAKADVLEALKPRQSPPHEGGKQAKWGTCLEYVYVLEFRDRGVSHIKIGISDNPDRRVVHILTCCPFDLSAMFICQAPDRKKAFGFEQFILLKYRKIGGTKEWLRMPSECVQKFVLSLSVEAKKRFGAGFMFKPHKHKKTRMPKSMDGYKSAKERTRQRMRLLIEPDKEILSG